MLGLLPAPLSVFFWESQALGERPLNAGPAEPRAGGLLGNWLLCPSGPSSPLPSQLSPPPAPPPQQPRAEDIREGLGLHKTTSVHLHPVLTGASRVLSYLLFRTCGSLHKGSLTALGSLGLEICSLTWSQDLAGVTQSRILRWEALLGHLVGLMTYQRSCRGDHWKLERTHSPWGSQEEGSHAECRLLTRTVKETMYVVSSHSICGKLLQRQLEMDSNMNKCHGSSCDCF